METKCCDEKNTTKNDIHLPCSKNCNCYLTQAATNIKKDISMRCKALSRLTRNPVWSAKLSPSERRLFSTPASGGPSFVCCVAARELAARDHDLADITEDQTKVTRQADRFTALNDLFCKRLVEAKSAIKSVESAIASSRGNRGEEMDEKIVQATKVLERSIERRRRMKEIFNAIVAHCHSEEETMCRLRCLADDRELNRVTLKSALGALVRLAFEAGSRERTCPEASALARFDVEEH